MIPRKTWEMFECGRRGEVGKLFRLQHEYLRMVEEVIAPLRRRELIDGAYDKVLMRLGGVAMPLRLLSPYEGFSEEAFEECRGIFEGKYRGWD
jgi:hypothetical protein